MCFSATASLAAGAILSVGGAATFNKKIQKSEYPFASIPIVFAVQQFNTGFLWLS